MSIFRIQTYTMKRVTGLGGIFFKSADPKKSMEWYQKHLGIHMDGTYGTSFSWRSGHDPDKKGFTVWSPMGQTTRYFDPSSQPFMLNFRVENLVELLAELKKEGIEQVGEMEEFEYGKFCWIMDPDGVKIELWEPNDPEYDKMVGEGVHLT